MEAVCLHQVNWSHVLKRWRSRAWKKEFEALGIRNEFELLVQQAHEEEEMEDKLIEDMAAVS